MLKPLYDVGDNVCAVFKVDEEITIIHGNIDTIEITKNDIKYLIRYNKDRILYVSQNRLFDTVRSITNKVANLLEEYTK